MRARWAIAALLLFGTSPAGADERHFPFTYETSVLPAGAREIEIWNTWRVGRQRFFSQLDHRVEFEVGLGHRLQTAFYLNFSSYALDDALGDRKQGFDFRGISSEWKLKLLDPIADVIGFAPYLEIEGSADLFELEAKLIFDKRIGRTLFAANIVGAQEWWFKPGGGTKHESELEVDLAGSYLFTPNVSVGLETRGRTEIADEGWEHTACYVGPVAAYSTAWWWAAFTASRQIAGVQSSPASTFYTLDAHEHYQVRLLFSFHL
jgi:hypothetical protein